jgi:hypothetical protein
VAHADQVGALSIDFELLLPPTSMLDLMLGEQVHRALD